MRVRSLLIAMVGMAVAGASVLASKELLVIEPVQASLDIQPTMVSVVVAGRDIQFGESIAAEKLATIQWPAASVPPGIYTSFDPLLPADGRDPRRAKRALAQGELLISSKISDFGEKVTIVQTLGDGKRAVAVRVSAETSVGGFVTPGDHVDVLLTQGNGDTLRSMTIIQNVRVVGIDQQADELNEQATVARTVTLEVTAEDGQKLALAQRAGTLSLSLRSLTAGDAPLGTIRLSDILNETPEVVAEIPKHTIKVRRGSDKPEEIELDTDADGVELN